MVYSALGWRQARSWVLQQGGISQGRSCGGKRRASRADSRCASGAEVVFQVSMPRTGCRMRLTLPAETRLRIWVPLLGGKDEAVQAGLHSNPVEFDGIKIRIIQPLPDSEKLHRAAVAEPVSDHIVRVVRVLEFGDVGKADDVLLALRKDGERGSLNFDGAS